MSEKLIIGDNIRTARNNMSLSQRQLAAKINCTHVMINRWENNQGKPSIDYLATLSKALNVTSDYLLGQEQNEIIQSKEEKENKL